jgi:hypothetical protein
MPPCLCPYLEASMEMELGVLVFLSSTGRGSDDQRLHLAWVVNETPYWVVAIWAVSSGKRTDRMTALTRILK